jgi:hypothetical protein
MKTAEVLDAAADLIERRGWWDGKKRMHVTQIGLCATQAIGRVLCHEKREVYYYHAGVFARYLGFKTTGNILDWNDSQTKDVVVSTLRTCALIERMKDQHMFDLSWSNYEINSRSNVQVHPQRQHRSTENVCQGAARTAEA